MTAVNKGCSEGGMQSSNPSFLPYSTQPYQNSRASAIKKAGHGEIPEAMICNRLSSKLASKITIIVIIVIKCRPTNLQTSQTHFTQNSASLHNWLLTSSPVTTLNQPKQWTTAKKDPSTTSTLNNHQPTPPNEDGSISEPPPPTHHPKQ